MIYNTDYKYFDKARQVALISDFHKTHIGCVAVYQGNVIGIGCNCNKTHPMQKKYNKYRKKSDGLLPKLHAEISCINSIRHLDINFSIVKIYRYRIRKDQPYGTCTSVSFLPGSNSGLRNQGYLLSKQGWICT